jgi:hypothetical protein
VALITFDDSERNHAALDHAALDDAISDRVFRRRIGCGG